MTDEKTEPSATPPPEDAGTKEGGPFPSSSGEEKVDAAKLRPERQAAVKDYLVRTSPRLCSDARLTRFAARLHVCQEMGLCPHEHRCRGVNRRRFGKFTSIIGGPLMSSLVGRGS